MNIAQLSEQLKDVPQGTLINYARDPNSVVPQFLALAEIQRRQHLQNTPQPPESTVAADVLNQAAPPPQIQPQIPQGVPQGIPQQMPPQMALPENQPGVVQLPTGMPQGMAGGGIVAFAGNTDGSLVDDEDTDEEDTQASKDENQMMAMLARIKASTGNAIAGIPRILDSVKESLPRSYETEKAAVDQVKNTGIPALIRGSHPYEAIALDEAKKLGIDPKLVQHILYKETGNLRDPATARSHAGAYGPMQLMPGTAKELGVNIADPEQNTRGGVRYFAKMLDQFGDPTLSLAAYNAGPGRVSKMLKSGRGIESLMPETQQYVRYSSGGDIKGYSGTDQDSLVGEDPYGKGDLMPINALPQPVDDPYFSYSDQSFPAVVNPAAVNPVTQVPPETATPPKSLDAFEQFIARNAKEREALKSGSLQDAALAIMQGGFGMMSGTSPYALVNFGKGAEQGISTYGALKKARSADLAALDKSELGGLRAKEFSDIKNYEISAANQRAKDTVEEKNRAAMATEALRKERLAASVSKEAADARETALARYNSDPTVKKIAAMISEQQLTPGTPEFTWNQNELNRLRNNAMAEAKVPGFSFIPEPAPYPKPEIAQPGSVSQWWNNYTPADIEALKWANAHPLDPAANAIKARFK
jgi:Transglycosylase SLT domain